MRKIIILIIVALTIGTAGLTIGIKKIREENERIDREAVKLKENRQVEFGQKAKVSDFIENLKGTLLNDATVDTNRIGKCEVSFDFLNIKNKYKKATFSIEIIDTVPPQIFCENSYTVNVGFKKKLTDILLSGDNIDDTPIRKIEGEYDTNTVGNYNLAYVVTDASGNETRRDFILHVVEKQSQKESKRDSIRIENIIAEYKNNNTKIGIDVSRWQGDIDWKKVKKAGVEFAILRVGYQKDYDNRNYEVDSFFIKNIEGATKEEIPIGIYFYSYAKSIEEANEQAEWVRNQIRNYKIDLPIAFDWESWNSFNTTNMSFYKINKVADTFLNRLEEYGYRGMLYGSKNYLEKIWYPTKYKTWLAHYTDKTSYKSEYLIWQMCDTGRVEGINGAVDIDIMYIS